MKNPFLLVALFIGLLYGCDKLVQFNMPYQTFFSIPSSPIGLLDDIATPAITTNTTQTYSNNNTEARLVTSVYLKSIKLTIISPEGKTFDFLQAADMFVSAPGLPEVKVATISGIEDSVGNSVEMTPLKEELKDYLQQDNITIKVRATTDKLVTQTVDIQIDAVFHVSANPLKLL